MSSLFGGLGPTIDKNAVKINNKINNMKKAIFVVLILIIIFIIYAYRSASKKENKAKKMLREEILEANNPRVIPDCEVNKPLNGIDFSCCFWIYMDKFYENSKFNSLFSMPENFSYENNKREYNNIIN